MKAELKTSATHHSSKRGQRDGRHPSGSPVTVGAFVLCLLLPTLAQAVVFDPPPETDFPGWQTAFPYQRNLFWDYAVDPQGGPSPSGLPGVVYEGMYDSALWGGDSVTFSGAAQWYNTLDGLPSYSGAVGIDNRNGTNFKSGEIIKKITNLATDNPNKHLDFQVSVLRTKGTLFKLTFSPDSATEVFKIKETEDLGNGLEKVNLEYQWTMEPNPASETITITYDVPVGSMLTFDAVKLASECVPEPTTASLLGLAAVAAGLCRRASRASSRALK